MTSHPSGEPAGDQPTAGDAAEPARPVSGARGSRRRTWQVGAAILAVVGVTLLIIALTTSRSGPPQPDASSAGSLSGPTAASSSSTGSTGGPSATDDTAADTDTTPAAEPSETPTQPSSTVWDVNPDLTAPQPIPAPHDAPPPPPAVGPIMAASAPTQLRIPAIGVDSSLLQLGLLPDGSIDVPPLTDPDSKAGWYTGSPSPGTQGPSILLGHVDSHQYGPGVFYNLGSLKPGDTVEVTRADGSVAVFAIDAVRQYSKDDFPTLEVYANLDHAGLRLITCGGTFDPSKSSYEDNIVAFGSLVASR